MNTVTERSDAPIPGPFRTQIPPSPTRYRPRREPAGAELHLYRLVRDLSHAAAGEGLSLAAVSVLTDLALRTERDGTTTASLRTVAAHLHRSPGIVHRHLKRLAAAGFIEQAGRCRADHRYRRWRIAGMDRRDLTRSPAVENHQRGPATSRAPGARHESTSRAPSARKPGELPGELSKKTRASPHQDPPTPAGQRTADGSGIAGARRVLRSIGPWQPAQSGSTPPRGARDDGRDPPAHSRAENGPEKPRAPLANRAHPPSPGPRADRGPRSHQQEGSRWTGHDRHEEATPAMSYPAEDYPDDDDGDEVETPVPTPAPDEPVEPAEPGTGLPPDEHQTVAGGPPPYLPPE